MNIDKPQKKTNKDFFAKAVFEPRSPHTAFAAKAYSRFDEEIQRAGDGDFFTRFLDSLELKYAVSDEDISRIPKDGPLVVVADGRFGAVEGAALMEMLGRVRSDARLLLDDGYRVCSQLEDRAFFWSRNPKRHHVHANARVLRASLRHVKGGGSLVVLRAPVSRLNPNPSAAKDPSSRTAILIAAAANAKVVPVLVFGGAPTLSELVKTRPGVSRLFDKFFKEHAGLGLFVGNPISTRRLSRLSGHAQAADFVWSRISSLRGRILDEKNTRIADLSAYEPLADPVPQLLLCAERQSLKEHAILLRHNDYDVFVSHADHIPHMLREIGRLREITFRAAGEGSKKSVDVDRFDAHYHHLVVWNRSRGEIAGAYRLGLTDELLARGGLRSLYTSTLFDYNPRLTDKFSLAIELGRSFVRPEYQRSSATLMLLWKGIAAFVCRHPQYHRLFGPVSISNDYATASQQLLVTFLEQNNTCAEDAKLVRPKRGFRRRKLRGWDPSQISHQAQDIDDVSSMLADIERDKKGVPVLIKQYLNLGGRILSFNVDPDFSDVVDALVYVDLLDTDRRVLARYMGKQPAEAFLAHHAHAERDEASTIQRASLSASLSRIFSPQKDTKLSA